MDKLWYVIISGFEVYTIEKTQTLCFLNKYHLREVYTDNYLYDNADNILCLLLLLGIRKYFEYVFVNSSICKY